MKTRLTLSILFLILFYAAQGQVESMVKLEAKCQCFYLKKRDQAAKRVLNKTRKKIEKRSSNAKPQSGRMFGGEEITINLEINEEQILEKRRGKNLKNYLSTLKDEEKAIFDEAVQVEMKTLCL